MRRPLATAAALAGLVAMTAPAAAQGRGYGGWSEPGVSVNVGFGAPGYYDAYAGDWGYPAGYRAPAAAYAYSGLAGCSCPTSAGYSYSSYRPAYRSTAYSYQPGYAAEAAYAYDPGYRYGSSVEYDTYAYRSGPRYATGGARVAVRGDNREITRSRNVMQSRSVAREQSITRTGARQRTVAGGSMRARGADMRAQSTVRSNGVNAQGDLRARSGEAMGGDATTGRGGAGVRGGAAGAGGSQPGMSNQRRSNMR